MQRFTGQVAIVTGAASGIGRATATRMAAEGASVIAVDPDQGALDALATRSADAAGMLVTDCSSALEETEVTRVVGETRERFGRIDALVTTVGGSTVIANTGTTIDALSLSDWQRLVDFNLTGTFLYINAVVPAMKARGAGKIVNVASIAGRGLSPVSSSAYATAKGGLIALTRKLSFELGPFGITCNAIAPGLTLTERITPLWEGKSETEQTAILANIPLGRLPAAEDQAAAICFLASSDADFVTGVTIDVTGGQR